MKPGPGRPRRAGRPCVIAGRGDPEVDRLGHRDRRIRAGLFEVEGLAGFERVRRGLEPFLISPSPCSVGVAGRIREAIRVEPEDPREPRGRLGFAGTPRRAGDGEAPTPGSRRGSPWTSHAGAAPAGAPPPPPRSPPSSAATTEHGPGGRGASRSIERPHHLPPGLAPRVGTRPLGRHHDGPPPGESGGHRLGRIG